MEAVVIGAGLGGLSAAIGLARVGYSVQVFETRDKPGGKAGELFLEGFRFDTGPSLLTLLNYFDDLFNQCNEKLSDYFTPLPLDPICHYFFPDNTRLKSYPQRERYLNELEQKLSIPKKQSRGFLDYSQTIYEMSCPLFLENSLHEWESYRKNLNFADWIHLLRIDPFRNMHRGISRFIKDPRGQQLFSRYATYNGSNPYKAPATLNLIAHTENGFGGYAVKEGIYSIVKGLHKLAVKMGVIFHFNTKVDRILHKNGKVTGIQSGSQQWSASVVVSNCDVSLTYKNLLQDINHPLYKRYQKLEPSSSGFVFYWGMQKQFPQLGINNIFFSQDYSNEFRQIFDQKQVPEDPTIYINITSKVNPKDAPQGCENWFVLINVPYDQGHDWKKEKKYLRERILRRLEKELNCPLKDLIQCESSWSPKEIQESTSSFRGSLYGISSNTPMAAFLRHQNRSKAYKGLYFCGGSVHPGGGMPLAVLSGKIVTDLVVKYEAP